MSDSKPETLAERITFLLKHSGGTMPIRMGVDTPEEAAQAKALLKGRRGGSLIQVCLPDADGKKYRPA